MDKLISLKGLIKEAKDRNINLGKGDPYNRLRYYTKIGWLPHMTRKLNKKNQMEGHYPIWVIDTLQKISDLKNLGFSNEDISIKITRENAFNRFLSILKEKEPRKRMVAYGAMILLSLVLIVEIKSDKPKRFDFSSENNILTTQIIDNGVGFMPKNRNAIFVKTKLVRTNAKINVTFRGDYYPASRYWVSKIDDLGGFEVKTDAPVSENVEFYWWISN